MIITPRACAATATEIMVTIGLVIAAEWVFVGASGALQDPVPATLPPAVGRKAVGC